MSLAVVMIALALVGLAAPVANAQAPAPKVTINGLIDQVMSYYQNGSQYSGIFNRKDNEWYSRTRGRFDIIGEVGKAKAVLGLEIDTAWGQTGSTDTNQAGTASGRTAAATTSSWDLNTDSLAVIEVKWLYTEFPMPLIPVPTTVRLGAQPVGAAANYKIAYATGDFAGVNIASQVAPNVKLLGTYVQVEEDLVGISTRTSTGTPASSPSGILSTQARGDDHAYIFSAEVTPFKGLDIKPMFSGFVAEGTTSSSSRQGRGGINTSTAFSPTGDFRGGINESRYTVGVDARLRMGPFSFDPTVMYQYGYRTVIAPATFAASGAVPGRKYRPDLDAWLIDLRGGFQLGPLLIEGLYMYTTGNSARNNTLDKVRYFQPLTTDAGYLADWGSQISALGIDYLGTYNSTGLFLAFPGTSIGWDKYGRQQVGLKATYAITPALSIMAGANGIWTAEAVDRNGTATSGAGILPVFNGATPRDNSRYVGTEFMALLSWKFAPGLSWDNAAGYMAMGSALDAITDPSFTGRNTNDPFIYSSRVRFTF
jgi:hypothetical protein